jgi:PEP-utilising enzyme, mobile domain
MVTLYVDSDRYGDQPANAIVEAYHSAIKDMLRRRFAEHGGEWDSFVFGKSFQSVSRQDFVDVEQRLLATGHRFAWSAMISAAERPDAYLPADLAGDAAETFSFEHAGAVIAAPDEAGREQRGVGDNVVRHGHNTVGVARYVRSSARVLAFMQDGVPADTIAIIDDSGGTLTAPILERFHGVVCAGGTARSHLGILTREYGIPCLMNAKLSGIREGDRIELETTAAARTADAYQKGIEMPARIWRLPAQG